MGVAALIAVVIPMAAVAASAERSADTQRAPTLRLRVGGIFPLTGGLAAFGPSLNESARLATREIRASVRRLGLANRMSVEIFTEDGGTNAGATTEAATKLVNSNRVQVLVGEMSSLATIPMAQTVAIPKQRVLIAPTVSAASFSDLDDDNYVYRMVPPDYTTARALATAAARAFGQRATLNVGARNDAFGTGLRTIFETEWKRRGGQIGESVTWDPNAASLDTEAQRFARGRPTGWVIIEFLPGLSKLVPPLIRSGTWDPAQTLGIEALRNAAELQRIGEGRLDGFRGVQLTSQGAPGRAALDRRFGQAAPSLPITGFEGTSFDAVMLSFLASVRAKSTRPALIKRHLRAVSAPPGRKYTFLQLDRAIRDLIAGREIDYEGASGSVNWNGKGDPGPPWRYEYWRFQSNAVSTISIFPVTLD
jgi:branched-chain amino acid transport system substrate-binding protein